jgi:hypothetical protein
MRVRRRAAGGSSGNAGTVGFYHRGEADRIFTRIGSVQASSAGRFSFTWYAEPPGTVMAWYRGNAARQPAVREVAVSVHTHTVRTRVAFDVSGGRRTAARPAARATPPDRALEDRDRTTRRRRDARHPRLARQAARRRPRPGSST